ncbi:MAG: FAD-binding protein, partial [Clostridiales bacterium]|nr:FAD-binding protein [Clostridiales bacterium]
ATGDGLAAAVRAGAKLKGMEFIQFHPTGLWTNKKENRAFLISESVRGEGGLLKNSDGERFMVGQHELSELAPRDIVARGITREMEKRGEDHVFVDITSKSAEYLEHRFPTIYNECKRRGIDISKDWIPVCPVQHYLIGGIQTDLEAQTSVDGLFACGEAASTGVHGANRLASNSMLECLVFGRRAADRINSRLAGTGEIKKSALPELDPRPVSERDFTALRHEIQSLMNEHCFVVRNEKGMLEAQARILEIIDLLEHSFYPGRAYIETYNIAAISRDILEAAINRRESVGAHYREDC